jgi:surface protein
MSTFTYRGESRTGGTTPMFISRWDTTQAGSANDTVVLPLNSSGSYDFYIDWGDGNRDNITGYNQAEVTHQYSDTGIYELRIHGGITGWIFDGAGDRFKLVNISKWGPLTPSGARSFGGCQNLFLMPDDELYLNETPDVAERFFAGGFSLSGRPNISIGPNVNTIALMFGQTSMTGDPIISDWDTSNVTEMILAFGWGPKFNQDLGNWDVSNVTGMSFLLWQNGIFNNGDSPSISGWDTSKVTNMQSMFDNCIVFNQPIGSWDTSSVTNIGTMLSNCDSFDQDLSNWIVTGVTNATSFMTNASGLSTTNYDSTLSGWAQQSGNLQSGVSINFGGSQYSVATGEQYKAILSGAGWTIVDGGSV